jgi:iron complex outermembrane receptor protein
MSLLSNRRALACGSAVLLALSAAPAAVYAQAAYDFDLPAQSLADSLRAVGSRAGVTVAFDPGSVRGQAAPALRGSYSAQGAVERLLDGSGLRLRRTRQGSFLVETAPAQLQRTAAVSSTIVQADPQAPSAAEEAPTGLEEIVVTAQKRSQRLSEVPLAVTALGGADLAATRTNTITDMSTTVPNVVVGANFGSAQINIRGIGLDNIFSGADPSVALHLDGAVIARPGAQIAALFDVDRVEVLRGPQGTLYGRNATGGAVNIITNKPTDHLDGFARATAGNYGLFSLEGAVGGPIVADRVDGRVALKLDRREGYGDNRFLHQDLDNARKIAARAQLDFKLSEDFSFLLAADYQHEDDRDAQYHFRSVAFASPPPAATTVGGTFASDPRDVNGDVHERNDRTSWSVTGTAEWSLSPAFTLKSISNYRYFNDDPLRDLDQTQVTVQSGAQGLTSRQASEEVQLLVDTERLKGVFGVYYFHEKQLGDNRLTGFFNVAAAPPIGSVSPAQRPDLAPDSSLIVRYYGEVITDAYAAFGNLTYDITPSVHLTAGARYSDEERDGLVYSYVLPGNNRANVRNGGHWTAFTPKIGLDWKPTDRFMTYVSYEKGFKSGVIQVGNIAPPVDPEKVTAYTVGFKSAFFDRRLTLDVDAFLYDFTDQQVSKIVPIGTNQAQMLFENAASSRIKGIEAEVSVAPVDGLRIDGFLAYLDAQYEDYVTSDPLAPAGSPAVQLSGNRLVNAPEWSARVRPSYALDISGAGRLTAAVDVKYRSTVYFTAQNDPRLSQDGVTTVDATLDLALDERPVTVGVWAKNITDEKIWVSTLLAGAARTLSGQLAPPATYGATISIRF